MLTPGIYQKLIELSRPLELSHITSFFFYLANFSLPVASQNFDINMRPSRNVLDVQGKPPSLALILIKSRNGCPVREHGVRDTGVESKCYVSLPIGFQITVAFEYPTWGPDIIDLVVDGVLRTSRHNKTSAQYRRGAFEQVLHRGTVEAGIKSFASWQMVVQDQVKPNSKPRDPFFYYQNT